MMNLEPRQRIKAMVKEILGVAIDKRAFTPVSPNSLTYRQLKGVISSKLFTIPKFSPKGEFEKWKARLVICRKKEEYTYDQILSPAVNAAIARKEDSQPLWILLLLI